MMTQKEIINIAEQKQLQTKTIEKDWVLGHFLNAMYSFEEVQQNFVFKGGTALKKCYFPDYRFSEDLDFTLLDKGFIVDERFVKKAMKLAADNSGARFHFQKQKQQMFNDEEQGYELKIKYWGADHKPNQKPPPPARWQTQIKLDISFSEKVFYQAAHKKIFHEYSDHSVVSATVPVYPLVEVVGEKLRSLIQRNRPRDIYDLNYLIDYLAESDFPAIKEVLLAKSADKNIVFSSVSDFVNDEKSRKNKRAWQPSLGDHLPVGALPDFDGVYLNTKQFIEKILDA